MYSQLLSSSVACSLKLQAKLSVQPQILNITLTSSESEHEANSHNSSGVSASYVDPLIVPLFPFGDKSRTCPSPGPSSKFQ